MADLHALRPSASERLASDIEEVFKALQPQAVALFQARKLGIQVHVPEPVRQAMMAAHGDDARRMLALLDGRISLDFEAGPVQALVPSPSPAA